MHLTQILSAWKGYRIYQRPRLPKGHIFRGKYRLVKKVTPLDLATFRRDLELEERNMFYLRHPFMTHREYRIAEKEHLKTFANKIINDKEVRYIKFLRTVEDRSLMSQFRKVLKASDKWE